MYKLAFFVPPSHVEQVTRALFAAGAGRIGAYDSCSWQVPGQGQFRPLDGSQPFQQRPVNKVDDEEPLPCVRKYRLNGGLTDDYTLRLLDAIPGGSIQLGS